MTFTALSESELDHVTAAQEWVEQGKIANANQELNEIAVELNSHPRVLTVRWQLLAISRRWNECVDVACAITAQEPMNPTGWRQLAEALHRTGQSQQAVNVLLPAAKRNPGNVLMCRDLARYFTRIGDEIQAQRWLESALFLADDVVTAAVQSDPELKPVVECMMASHTDGPEP